MNSCRPLSFVVAAVTLALVSCGGVDPDLASVDDPAAIDDLHLQIPELDPTGWVERLDPEKTWDGLTLVMYRRRVPMLVDTAGRIVHIWPRVRATARVRLDSDGRLLVIGTDNLIKVYDWDGGLEWCYRLRQGLDPHHDVARLHNGHILVLAQDDQNPRGDYLLEIDRSGKVVWEWAAGDHRDRFPSWNESSFYPTHVNSVRELPPNRWFDDGDLRFQPGNILVSARNLNTIFVVERPSGDVVWQYRRYLDHQHEAVMIPKEQLGAGLILLFNNGLKNLYGYRRSAMLAVDPVTRKAPWRYSNRFFFSSIAGTGQALPNGNVLISSSQGGRVFEITPDREIVWQWTPPFHPMRPERYPWDHCPQFARIERQAVEEIPSRRGRPHVDQDLHVLAVSGEYRSRSINGEEKQLVNPNVRCRELVIPPRPQIHIGYGIDLERLGTGSLTASFRFSLRRLDEEEQTVFFEDAVDSTAGEPWREHWLPIEAKPYRRYEMCVDVESEGTLGPERAEKTAVFLIPRIYSGDQPSLPAHFYGGRLSEQERAIREQQLKALGYVN